MTVQFSVPNRINTSSTKWDERKQLFQNENVLPMWIADMDFKAPKEVNDILKERIDHGVYGYTFVSENVKKAVCKWVHKRHGWEIETNTLSFSPGVCISIDIIIQQFTKENDSILIQTPVYTPFFDLIQKRNRKVVTNPLILQDDNKYVIDWDHLEEQLKNDIKAFVFCSPHNPVGRVWKKEELEKIVQLCEKYDVLLISDEIHSDLILPGYKHIPVATVSNQAKNRTITLMSPSKTFNLAGLQASFIVTENEELKKDLDKKLIKEGFKFLNTLGITALEASYNYGEKWLDALNKRLDQYTNNIIERFEKEIPEIKIIRPEGTYLLWIDFRNLSLTDDELNRWLIDEANVALNRGIDYGEEGSGFMRMNIATSEENINQACEQIIKAVQNKR